LDVAVAERGNRAEFARLAWRETENRRLQQKAALAKSEHAAKRLRESEETSEEKTARDANLWSSEESFQMLSNELFGLKTSRTCPFQADAVENDAHVWDVRLSHFSGPLQEDCISSH
jgi:hypothetical protein